MTPTAKSMTTMATSRMTTSPTTNPTTTRTTPSRRLPPIPHPPILLQLRDPIRVHRRPAAVPILKSPIRLRPPPSAGSIFTLRLPPFALSRSPPAPSHSLPHPLLSFSFSYSFSKPKSSNLKSNFLLRLTTQSARIGVHGRFVFSNPPSP